MQLATRDYTIRNGTAYKIDGVAYLVEHDDTPDGIRVGHEVLQHVFNLHRDSVGPHDPGYQRAYLVAERESPAEALYRQAGRFGNDPDQHLAATAGDGSSSIWGYTRSWFRHDRLGPVLQHEYGHNVGALAPRMPSGERVDDSPEWHAAGMQDVRGGGPSQRVSNGRIIPGTAMGNRGLYINAGAIPGTKYEIGVTPYGTSNQREDFGESVMMYLHGQIGVGVPQGHSGEVPIYFRDFFPHRAAMLDALFPDHATEQLAQIARERTSPTQGSS